MSAQSRGVEEISWRVVEKEHNKINDKWLCVCLCKRNNNEPRFIWMLWLWAINNRLKDFKQRKKHASTVDVRNYVQRDRNQKWLTSVCFFLSLGGWNYIVQAMETSKIKVIGD